MLNNDQATERPELAELFWMRPHQFLGCAGCTRSHKKWINELRRHRQFVFLPKVRSRELGS